MRPSPPDDFLEEFASEQAPTSATRDRTAASRPWRRPAVFAVAAFAAVTFLVPFVLDRGTTEQQPPPAIAPLPSPIEVEYPEYPGAPLLQAAATAMPARLAPGAQAEEVSGLVPTEARTIAPVAVNRERREAPRRAVSPQLVEPAAAHAFDVRGPVPQAASTVPAAVPIANEEQPQPRDAPPRRIGPPIAVTTLGGSAAQQGRVVLVLEITEQGDVARVVSREGVDVHPDVIDSVAAAARSWRYTPARREGVAVPARVRVVVQLNGAGN